MTGGPRPASAKCILIPLTEMVWCLGVAVILVPTNSRRRSRPFFGGFGGSPVGRPFTISQDLLAAMNGEFNEHRPSGDAQHLATDVDDAPPEFETLIERAATPDLDKHHRDRLQTVRAKVEQVVLAKLRNPHIGAPKLRLHHLRVETAQACRELALDLRWISLGKVETQIRHGRVLPGRGHPIAKPLKRGNSKTF